MCCYPWLVPSAPARHWLLPPLDTHTHMHCTAPLACTPRRHRPAPIHACPPPLPGPKPHPNAALLGSLLCHTGASEEAIADVPTILCHVASPLLGQTCPICLAGFEAGDTLKSITCLHYHHEDCLDQWLRVKACCPACREAMPS